MRNRMRFHPPVPRGKRTAEPAVKLAEALQDLMDEKITPRQARSGNVVEVWNQLLPAELRQHCRIVEISAGRLKVLTDSPAYRYEMQLCRAELLSQIQQQCPKARIRDIDLVAGQPVHVR